MRASTIGSLLLVASASALYASGGARRTLGPSGAPAAGGGARGGVVASAGRQLDAAVVGCGSSRPGATVSNELLSTFLDTSDEWIAARTGIKERRVLAPGESLGDHSAAAGASALEMAGVDGAAVDLVIVATSSPDDMFGDATAVAAACGCSKAVAFDVTAACSGFLFALVTAGQFLDTGSYETALVVGADALSRWVDWDDRNACILFGDGAGAVVLRRGGGPGVDVGGPGILGFAMRSDGAGRSKLACNYNGKAKRLGDTDVSVTDGAYDTMTMQGKAVYVFATREVPAILEEALDNAGITIDDVDWLLLHQANIRIMQSVAERFGVPMDRVLTNLDECGNTSAGSIPLALDAAVRQGKLKHGDVVACAGFGAGLSWGAAVFKWAG